MTKAVIFDMDGVLISSAQQHFEAWREVSADYDMDLDYETFKLSLGRDNKATIARFWGDTVSKEEGMAIANRKEKIFRDIISTDFQPVPGAPELIAALHKAGWKMALGTSAPPENAAHVLSLLPGGDLITARVDSSMVENVKPEPDIFLKAASLLDADPDDCIVIEDSISGLKAAAAAGMARLALATSTEIEIITPLANAVRDDLVGVTPEFLAELIDLEQRNRGGD